jgi:hypothetical protein
MDYEDKYESILVKYNKLKDYLVNLEPYCNNCANTGDDSRCDECNRKYFNWKFDASILEQIVGE